MTKQIAVIGGGIGGLTAALALQRKGNSVTVYEAAEKIEPVGAGIGIGNNAMQIFQMLGVANKIYHAGTKVSSMNITDAQLKPLSVMKLGEFERKYGVHNVAIHRADLQQILAEELGFKHIKLGKKLSQITSKQNIATLTFEDQSTENADLVIAADGIKSAVRTQLFPQSKIRDTKQWCWRGVCDASLSQQWLGKAMEAWGKGKRFGFVMVNDKTTYWYAVVNENLVDHTQPNLTKLYQDFHPEVAAIITKTSQEKIILNRITDLKPLSKWHEKNICLLGDAAHATTPNLGQGACQAIEDAYALAQLYHPEKPVHQLFKEYEQLRMKKAKAIVKSSWLVGKVAHLENNGLVFLRNIFVRNIPKKLSNQQLKTIFDIDYMKSTQSF